MDSRLSTRTYYLIGFLLLVSYAIPFAPQVTYVDHAFTVMLATSALLTAAFFYFLWRQARAAVKPVVEMNVRRTHFIQALAQSSILVYTSFYWSGVADWAPFIVYQLIVAFVFDFLLTMFRFNRWKLGFQIFPIVMSINLFMWFKPEFFIGQLAMAFGGVLGKAYIVRKLNGRPIHIFNPSALPMAITAVLIVLILNAEYMLNTNNIVASYLVPPYMHLFIFLAGMFSHLAGGVSFIALGAVGTLFLIDFIFTAVFGMPPMGDVIHPSVFIGITLLVTDPVTSPKTRIGQLVYGSLYGVGIAVSYVTLHHFDYPTYYDKILPVPILNYLAPYIDRIRLPQAGFMRKPIWQTHWAPAIVYAVVFLMLVPTISNGFMRKTYFIERREQDPGIQRPDVREPVERELQEKIRTKLVGKCTDDPTLRACWLLQRESGPPRIN